jgi:hypothetical protein
MGRGWLCLNYSTCKQHTWRKPPLNHCKNCRQSHRGVYSQVKSMSSALKCRLRDELGNAKTPQWLKRSPLVESVATKMRLRLSEPALVRDCTDIATTTPKNEGVDDLASEIKVAIDAVQPSVAHSPRDALQIALWNHFSAVSLILGVTPTVQCLHTALRMCDCVSVVPSVDSVTNSLALYVFACALHESHFDSRCEKYRPAIRRLGGESRVPAIIEVERRWVRVFFRGGWQGEATPSFEIAPAIR